MSEYISFNSGGEEVEVSPESAILYRYRGIGDAALNISMYDHIFVTEDDETGYYLFLLGTDEETKNKMTEAMQQRNYTCYLNLREVAECDIRAFDDIVIKPKLDDIDTVPEEWT